jgi:aminomethyltransferase
MERFQECAKGLNVTIVDDTESQTMVAIQGPQSQEILDRLGFPQARKLKYYRFENCPSRYGTVILSRTGYTGEVGFEIFLPATAAVEFFREALSVGEPLGLLPCGLGARDTLRLEAGMPLHGHEISESVNPIEANLQFALRSEAPFVGREALDQIAKEGPKRKLIGLLVEGKRIPRQDCDVLHNDQVVGRIASGTRSITLGYNIATALVRTEVALEGAFTISIRGNLAEAKRVPMPFYVRKD